MFVLSSAVVACNLCSLGLNWGSSGWHMFVVLGALIISGALIIIRTVWSRGRCQWLARLEPNSILSIPQWKIKVGSTSPDCTFLVWRIMFIRGPTAKANDPESLGLMIVEAFISWWARGRQGRKPMQRFVPKRPATWHKFWPVSYNWIPSSATLLHCIVPHCISPVAATWGDLRTRIILVTLPHFAVKCRITTLEIRAPPRLF